MNKTASLFLFMLIAAPLLAASTCETRVDKNPTATTAQRVALCLQEEELEPEDTPAEPEIMTEIYTVQYPAKKTKKQHTGNTKVHKKYKKEPVNTEFLDQDKYPRFHNDIWPRMNQEEAHQAAREALEQSTQAKDTEKQKKPAVKKTTKPKRIQRAAAAAPAYTEEIQPAAQATSEPTPAEDLAQAQQLENDPLYQSYPDNGAAPAGFTDDGLMGPDSFGYNNTDPALQSY